MTLPCYHHVHCPEPSPWTSPITLAVSFHQAWKHLSSKVCEILEELRAVQVCVSV